MQIKCLEWCLAHIERPVGGGGKIIHSLTSISHQFTELLRHAIYKKFVTWMND